MTETPVKVESSKVQILNAPILPPGVCMLCGSSRNDDRQYIDIGKDIEFVGVMYFCTFCMTEVANALGCLMPEQARALENELDAARQRILEFHKKDEALNGAINTLRDTGLFSGIDLTVVRRGHVPSTSEESKSDVQDVIRTEREPDESNQDPEQSDSEQGPTDLSATRDDEFGFGSLHI